MFIVSLIIIASLSVMVCQLVKNYRYKELADDKAGILPWLMGLDAALFTADMFAGGDVGNRMTADLLLSLIAILTLLSSVWKQEVGKRIVKVVCGMQLALATAYLLCALGLIPVPGAYPVLVAVLTLSLAMSWLFLHSMWSRIREVRSVMKSGTVWQNLCLNVDVFYLLCIQMTVSLFLFVSMLRDGRPGIHTSVTLFLLGCTLVAAGLRVVFDSVFVLLHRHERRIVESMKISHVEVSAASDPKFDDMYRDVYERIIVLFEMKKPFLNSELTINDVVKVVYTNKLYISKAISHYTGRNFCQFVNYHRVIHSMELFRNSPELKVAELAAASGFNSIVSFSMAFRLFMNENPSDWCRKERLRLLKTKK